ncbi:MAG: MgtC/SapB family protein [Euryarchaeota archaeon]|nr:MgtC/SapB family protein [Euryarchaeota archaeon]
MMVDTEFIKMLLISALVGGLLGVERELKVQVIAGTRTFMLVSITGTLSVYLAAQLGVELVVSIATLGVVLLVLLLGVIKNFRTFDVGITTPVAFFLAYLIGVLVGLGLYIEAVTASILVTSILVFKKYTTILSEALGHEEMRSAMEFGLIAFVLYPVAPDYAVDPLGILNPRHLLLAVIVVSTTGFAGFLVLRFLGSELSSAVAGAMGGLVSLRATVGTFSREASRRGEIARDALGGMLLSCSSGVLRSLLLAGLLSVDLLRQLWLPAGVMAAVTAAAVLLPGRSGTKGAVELPLRSPFAILPSLRFALLFSAVAAVAGYPGTPQWGVYIASLIGGGLGAAATVGALASLVELDLLEPSAAAPAALLALVGGGMAAARTALLGNRRLGVQYSAGVLLGAAAGFAALLLA